MLVFISRKEGAQLLPKAKEKKSKRKTKKNYVVVSNSSYGKALKGQRIYFEGKRPPRLSDDGRITFGKNILETLGKKFGERFRWIITEDKDEITVKYGITYVRTSQALLNRMFSENFERSREVKNDIVQRRFFSAFPTVLHHATPIGLCSRLDREDPEPAISCPSCLPKTRRP